MEENSRIIKICGWCGITFYSFNRGEIEYCCEECKQKAIRSKERERNK
ncbi:hypothetical protein KGF47_18075 [Clostridioides sp. ZZV13-5731]|nr:hypothetical protein [Clostridioides sp. ZZV13-5731]